MQINITGRHIEVTDALKTYIEEKLQRLARHFERLTQIHVMLHVEKERHRAEATIHVSRGEIFADAEEENMYAAIDGLVGKLDRQIKKHKEKLHDHHRGEGLKQRDQNT